MSDRPTTEPRTDECDVWHANLILSIRWPDAAEGETVKYRPLIGEWNAATDWQRTARGWRPVSWAATIQKYLTPVRVNR